MCPFTLPCCYCLDCDFEEGKVTFLRTFKCSINFGKEGRLSQLLEVQKHNSLLVCSNYDILPLYTPHFTLPASSCAQLLLKRWWKSKPITSLQFIFFSFNILNCFQREKKVLGTIRSEFGVSKLLFIIEMKKIGLTEKPQLFFHVERWKLRFMIMVSPVMKDVQGVKINLFPESWRPRIKGIQWESKAVPPYKSI